MNEQTKMATEVASPVNTEALAGKLHVLRNTLCDQEQLLISLLIRLRGNRPEPGDNPKIEEDPALLLALEIEVGRAHQNAEMICELSGLVD